MSLINKISYQLDILNRLISIISMPSMLKAGADLSTELNSKMTFDKDQLEKKDIESDLHEIITDFNLKTFDMMNESGIVEDLDEILADMNIGGRLLEVFNRIKVFLKPNELQQYEKEFNKYQLNITLQNDLSVCKNCGETIETGLDACKACGASVLSTPKFGVDRGSSSSGMNEAGQKKRKGVSAENTINLKKALNELQGTSTLNIPEEDLKIIENAIRNYDKKIITSLMCDDLRLILKKSGMTKYNDKVPNILRRYTGCSLMIYTDWEIHVVSDLWITACIIFADTIRKNNERSNKLGRYYMLYKISEHVIKDKERLDRLTQLIHFPNFDTLIRFDRTWEKMCADPRLNIPYKKTSHTLVS